MSAQLPPGVLRVRAVMAAPEPVTLPRELQPARSRHPDERAIRQDRMAELLGAVQETHPDDARMIAAAVLLDLPVVARIAPFGGIEEDARWWAAMLTPLAALPITGRAAAGALGPTDFHGLRKRLLLALFGTLAPAERAAFLAHVGGRDVD